MKTDRFIPGVWEEEINVADFLKLNKKNWEGDFVATKSRLLSFPKGYDLILDKDKVFTYISPCSEEEICTEKEKSLFISESSFLHFTEATERKKMLDVGLIIPMGEEKEMFLQPDIGIIALYGTRFVIKEIKEYLKKIDNQLKTQEWLHKKINLNRCIESLHKFEEFAKTNKIQVKNPCSSAQEVTNVLWVTTYYALMENKHATFSLYGILLLLDVFIENDIKEKKMDEEQAQQIVDEFYCKVYSLVTKGTNSNGFGLNIVIASNMLTKTTYRFLESASRYPFFAVPFQLIFNSESFSETMVVKMKELYEEGFSFTFSQSLRKKDKYDLSITPFHSYFKNYEDVVFQFYSFDLHKALLLAINGGKDTTHTTNFYQVSTPIRKEEMDFESVLQQYETFLRYFVTLYSEHINAYAYYYDQYHNYPFREALISHYPHYLINLPFHNVMKVVNILTSIYEKEFDLIENEKGQLIEIKPKTDSFEEFIGARLNDILHKEIKRLLFYKNGNYSMMLFAESPFFRAEDNYDIESLSPISFLQTSFSGYKEVDSSDFITFLNDFKHTGYTHIRLKKTNFFLPQNGI